MTDQKLMTANEVAEYLRVKPRTVERMAARGELPGRKIARQWRFRQEDVLAYVVGEPEKPTRSERAGS